MKILSPSLLGVMLTIGPLLLTCVSAFSKFEPPGRGTWFVKKFGDMIYSEEAGEGSQGQLSLRRVAACTIAIAVQFGTSTPLLVNNAALADGIVQGLTTLDGNDEARRLFAKARQTESDGDFIAAQEFYQQVVQGEPEFIYGWANLANVLVQRGNLEQGLLCYKKALSLRPPAGEQLSTILLNTASTEMALGKTESAVRDLDLAEKVGGPTDLVKINKAVILTQAGKWAEGCENFEKVFKTSEKDALPWWLRYSMALLETDRGPEAVAYMQRVLQRYPYETEVKAFGVALYSALGSPQEANRYWKQMNEAERALYRDDSFLSQKVKWGPVAIRSFDSFKERIP